MAVTKADYNNWHTLSGTLAEVGGALNTNKVLTNEVVAIFHDGTSYIAVYRKSEAS